VYFPTTFQDPQQFSKREIHLAHDAKTPKPKSSYIILLDMTGKLEYIAGVASKTMFGATHYDEAQTRAMQ
jgi:hypothetical protein